MKRIIASRANIKDDGVYLERHHIIPKVLGGSNEADNLIYLYAEEHYHAHKLLALENPLVNGLLYAWWNMCQCNLNNLRVYDITAEDYNRARQLFLNNMKGNSYALGQKLSEETRKKMSDARKGKNMGVNNHRYGKPCSEDSKNKLREKLSGAKNPSARKVLCLETGEIFTTVKSAAEWCNIGHADIAAYIRGRQKSAGKHPVTQEKLHWKYIE